MLAREPESLPENCGTDPAAESSASIKENLDYRCAHKPCGSGSENFRKVQESLFGDAVAAMVWVSGEAAPLP